MPAATSSKSSTNASSAPPRCARPRSSSWWRRATASTPARWCARSRKRASGFRFLEAPGLELLIGHAELRLLRLLETLDDLVQRHRGDEAQIERPGHGDMRPRLELAAPLVQVDLLLAEAEREPLRGRRLEVRELHAEHFV